MNASEFSLKCKLVGKKYNYPKNNQNDSEKCPQKTCLTCSAVSSIIIKSVFGGNEMKVSEVALLSKYRLATKTHHSPLKFLCKRTSFWPTGK